MAGLSDVLDAVLKLATDAVYPNGAVAGNSPLGFDVILGVGWPDDAELQATVGAGRAFVSIFPLPGERSVTEWEYDTQDVARPPVGIQVSRAGDGLAFVLGGVAGPGDVLGVAWRGTAYTLALPTGATAEQAAQAVAARLPAGIVAGIVGATLTFTYAPDLLMRTGNNGVAMMTLGAIQRRVQLTVWGFDQQSRNRLYDVLAVAVQRAHFLNVTIPDVAAVEAVRISYSSGTWDDKPQNAGGYVRGLIALVEFQTTVYQDAYAILFTDVALNSEHYGLIPA